MHVGRNETCPCGSGRKYKSCCAGKTDTPKGLIVLLVVFAIIAGVAVIPSLGDKNTKSAPLSPAPSAPANKPGPQPPGPVPPGKVWSTEHGHWHDIAGGTNPASSIKVEPGTGLQNSAPLTPVVGNAPQPPGPAPAGKVWSPEHGHWHDAPK